MKIPALAVTPEEPIQTALRIIDSHEAKIALLTVPMTGELLATITDGDIRRALLDGLQTSDPIADMARSLDAPITAAEGALRADLLLLMNTYAVRQVPIVDERGRPVGIETRKTLDAAIGVRALVMAGGRGERLRPLTDELPKPLLAVRGQPMIDTIVEQIRTAGIEDITISVRYRGDMIRSHFGSAVEYVEEDEPLGTAGALGLMPDPAGLSTLIINGDVLTDVDLRGVLDWAKDYRADLCVAMRDYRHRVPFGVIASDGIRITGIKEKPEQQAWVAAGVYVVGPDLARGVSGRVDMPELIMAAVAGGCRVIGYPICEAWADIGNAEALREANE